MKAFRMLGAGLFAATVLGAGGTTGAVNPLTSWQGDDYSQDLSNITQVKACDRESDGHSVHTDYVRIGSPSQYKKSNGGGSGTCAYTIKAAQIYKHRIVEAIPFAEDPKGAFVYPT